MSPREFVLKMAPVLVPWGVALALAVAGVDFGEHVDEHFMIESLERTIDREILLPGFYNYPSMLYTLCVASMVPDIVHTLARNPRLDRPRVDALKAPALARIRSMTFRLRARTVCAVVASLAIVWVYALVLLWRRRWGEAFVAGSFLALSWEVNYHMRWIAVDSIMMQFGALTMLLTIAYYLHPERRILLGAAAIAAGLATSSKYPGGLLVLPVALAALMAGDRSAGPVTLIKQFAALGALFVGGFLLITPGMVLEPVKFSGNVLYEFSHYRTGHYGYTVTPGFDHLERILRYYGLAFFSHYAALSLIVIGLAVLGCVVVLRKSKNVAMLYLLVPVLYTLYFATQHVMFIRNLEFVAPFIAVCAGIGVGALWSAGRNPARRFVLLAGLVACFAINAAWLVHTVQTIHDRDSDRFVREAADYADAHPDTRFYMPKASASRFRHVGALPKNVTEDSGEASSAMFIWFDGFPRGWQTYPANDPDSITAWFGPLNMNFPYNTSFPGEFIAVMPMNTARRFGVEGTDISSPN